MIPNAGLGRELAFLGRRLSNVFFKCSELSATRRRTFVLKPLQRGGLNSGPNWQRGAPEFELRASSSAN